MHKIVDRVRRSTQIPAASQDLVGLNGDEATAYAAKQSDVDVVAAYPITPQTIIVERFSEFVADGEVDTEGGLYLKPHDLARIAYLVLRNGRWEDRKVVSEEWIRESARPWVQFPDPEGGASTRGYGYQWWLGHEDGETASIAGSGFGGQFPVVVPGKDLVVVFNAWNNHDRPPRNSAEAILTRIVPAAR